MGWNEYSKADKIKLVLSLFVLLGLVGAFILGKVDVDEEHELLVSKGERCVGVVFDRYKPYKGSRELKYYFYVGNKKYERTATSSKRFPTDIGDMRVVVYDPSDPILNRMLLHEVIMDSIDIQKYLNSPIVINP